MTCESAGRLSALSNNLDKTRSRSNKKKKRNKPFFFLIKMGTDVAIDFGKMTFTKRHILG